jgi:predicted membrane channel-forming protein YqfA (hemolysin III family)
LIELWSEVRPEIWGMFNLFNGLHLAWLVVGDRLRPLDCPHIVIQIKVLLSVATVLGIFVDVVKIYSAAQLWIWFWPLQRNFALNLRLECHHFIFHVHVVVGACHHL